LFRSLLLASAGGFLARSIACESPELTALEVIDIGGLVGLRRCWWHGLGRLLRSGWRRLGRTSRRSRGRTNRYGLGSGWEGLWAWPVLRVSCEGCTLGGGLGRGGSRCTRSRHRVLPDHRCSIGHRWG